MQVWASGGAVLSAFIVGFVVGILFVVVRNTQINDPVVWDGVVFIVAGICGFGAGLAAALVVAFWPVALTCGIIAFAIYLISF